MICSEAPPPAALEDLRADPRGGLFPLLGDLLEFKVAGEAGTAIDRDPDHQLRGDVVPRLAA